jgi:hypothetical protein
MALGENRISSVRRCSGWANLALAIRQVLSWLWTFSQLRALWVPSLGLVACGDILRRPENHVGKDRIDGQAAVASRRSVPTALTGYGRRSNNSFKPKPLRGSA